MPCNSDYLNPTDREYELQRAAGLLIYVRNKLGIRITEKLRRAADDIYCRNDYVAALCGTLRKLSPEETETIVYDAHDPKSRDLANWWEEHQRADRVREKQELENRQKKLDQYEQLKTELGK